MKLMKYNILRSVDFNALFSALVNLPETRWGGGGS